MHTVTQAKTSQYLETAYALDDFGLCRQADNIEALIRVGAVMNTGTPLFDNRREHEDYLALLQTAKQTFPACYPSRTSHERQVLASVLSELERRVELWEFFLGYDGSVRTASDESGNFWSNASGNAGELPGQMLDQLRPVLVHLWENGIRLALMHDSGVTLTADDRRKWRSTGRTIKGQYETQMTASDNLAYRPLSMDEQIAFALAQEQNELRKDIEPSGLQKWQGMGLKRLQNPEVYRVAELLIAKALEPEMLKTHTPEGKQQIANNAAQIMRWFFEPIKLNKAGLAQVSEKASMLGMPDNALLPDGFFDKVAGGQDVNGVRFFDQPEVEYLKEHTSAKPGASILALDTQPTPPVDEQPEPEAFDAAVSTDELNSDAWIQPETPLEAPPETVPIPVKPRRKKVIKDTVVDSVPEVIEESREIGNTASNSAAEKLIDNIVEMFVVGFREAEQEKETNPAAYENYVSQFMALDKSDSPVDINAWITSVLGNPIDTQLTPEQLRLLRTTILAGPKTSHNHTPGVSELTPGQILNQPAESESQMGHPDSSSTQPGKVYHIGPSEPQSSKWKKLLYWLIGSGMSVVAAMGVINKMTPGGAAAAGAHAPSEYSRPAEVVQPAPAYQEPVRQRPVYQPPKVTTKPQVSPDGTANLTPEQPKLRSRWNLND